MRVERYATRFLMLPALCFVFTLAAAPLTARNTGQGGDEDIESLKLAQLPAPVFNRPSAASGKAPASGPRLAIVSSKRNQITDEEAWFAANDLKLPLYRVTDASSASLPELPPNVPTSYKGNLLIKAIRQDKTITLIYGKDYASGRYLIAMDKESGKFRYGFDFINYTQSPEYDAKDRDFVFQSTEWAVEEGNTIYVSHNHLTYARSSRGKNAYITAIDTRTNRVLWRSQPLVSNANNFEVINDLIVCGYGFTAEPDFLYLLDKKTGDVKQQLAVKSKADYIIHKNNKIYVRMYDTDLVVNLK
jgi:hypothetical protein